MSEELDRLKHLMRSTDISCGEVKVNLDSYSRHTLEPRIAARIGRHLRRCKQCSSERDSLLWNQINSGDIPLTAWQEPFSEAQKPGFWDAFSTSMVLWRLAFAPDGPGPGLVPVLGGAGGGWSNVVEVPMVDSEMQELGGKVRFEVSIPPTIDRSGSLEFVVKTKESFERVPRLVCRIKLVEGNEAVLSAELRPGADGEWLAEVRETGLPPADEESLIIPPDFVILFAQL